MSEFKELIKAFPKTREYVRDFFVYGFKTRDEFREKSPRTYDNERRRIESWLSGFVRQDYTEKGKNISLAIDSNLLDTNPLYRVWKTKSFTDNDIMLHFFLLDYLTSDIGKSVENITDGILDTYGVFFDTQTIRRKCAAYEKEGLLQKEKCGKEVLYKKTQAFPTDCLGSALSFYQLAAPLGIVGDTILDNMNHANSLFRIKHSFLVHTLEDEILLTLLEQMHMHYSVLLHIKSSKNSRPLTQKGIPLQIFTSTRTGRRYLCMYTEKKHRFCCFRLDTIKKVEPLAEIANYTELKDALIKNHKLLWGVSFQNDGPSHTNHIKLTLSINESTEGFIVNRLEREGKGGKITKTAPNTYVYENEIFDANEMLPWIRTFTGRIIDLECDSENLTRRFRHDMKAMYNMYNISGEDKK